MARFNEGLQPPSVLIFDWHGTLVDTHDAMFSAMEEMLPQLEELGLVEQLLPEDQCRTEDDARLVRYIRIFRRLHPRILAERRVSRTDIFNAIFGDNKAAKLQAHKAYNNAYRKYFGRVKPFQPGAYEYLSALKAMGIKLAVSTNRNREFLDKELDMVDEGRWHNLFDATVCADDVTEYKPDPQVIVKVLEQLELPADQKAWYIGDSYVDMLTAHHAGVSGVFYNGACWEPERIDSWFTRRDAPAAVLDSFEDLMDLMALLEREQPDAFSASPAEVRPKPFPVPERPLRYRERLRAHFCRAGAERIRLLPLQQRHQVHQVFKAVQNGGWCIAPGEPAVDTFRLPASAVVEHARHPRMVGGEHIHVAVADIPGLLVCRQFQLLQHLHDHLRVRFVFGDIVGTHGGVKQVMPAAFVHHIQLFVQELPVTVGGHRQLDAHGLEG